MPVDAVQFCSRCGHRVGLTIPSGDNRPRHVCQHPTCGQIHYQNPKVVSGCIPTYGDKILLCQRAIQPCKGLWTLPAGFMENGETLAEAASRETMEEACAPLNNLQLYAIYNLPNLNQVTVIYRAELAAVDGFSAGAESLDVALFDERQIPWPQIAFRVIELTLQRYLSERQTGQFNMMVQDLR